MASPDAWAPMQIVGYDAAKSEFTVVSDPLLERRFAALPKPLKILGVIGATRGGKSVLMNFLHYFPESPFGRGERGFATGPTTVPVTKGIWMWAKPLPEGEGSLVLLDTEVKDLANADPAYDAKVVAITIAICTPMSATGAGPKTSSPVKSKICSAP